MQCGVGVHPRCRHQRNFSLDLIMKLHVHVPKLHEFALDAACDDVVMYGMHGLCKPMPRPLYLQCMSTFADKYDNRHTVMKMYDIIRRHADTAPLCVGRYHCLRTAVLVLDHAAIDNKPDELHSLLTILINESYGDVDSAVECLQRFAERCTTACEVGLLVDLMGRCLSCHPCKSLRSLLISYGGQMDRVDVMHACRCGAIDVVRKAVDDGHIFNNDELSRAIYSADIETIELVAGALGDGERFRANVAFDAFDFDVQTCECLVRCNIISNDNYCHLYSLRSVVVAEWFIEHGLVNVEHVTKEAVRNAVRHGGDYIDVLHYLTEERRVSMPSCVFLRVDIQVMLVHMHVVDYLIAHGADVNMRDGYDRSILTLYPLYIRYWMDKGFKFKPSDRVQHMRTVANCARSGCFNTLLILLRMDVGMRDVDDSTLIHHICRSQLNKQPCDSIDKLIQYGAEVNAVDKYGRTPLHIACRRRANEYLDGNQRTRMIKTLCMCGADVNVIDSDGHSAYDVAEYVYDRRLLCEYGYVPK